MPTICIFFYIFFFFNESATTEIYPLSLHAALPISPSLPFPPLSVAGVGGAVVGVAVQTVWRVRACANPQTITYVGKKEKKLHPMSDFFLLSFRGRKAQDVNA